jgi:hypothetical protein
MIHVDAFMFMLRHAPLRVSLFCIIAFDGPHVFPYACLSVCVVFLGYQHLKTS